MITVIESRQNATLRHLARLGKEKKYRLGADEMVCEGGKMLGEALQSGVRIKTVLLRTGDALDDTLRADLDRAARQGARLFEADAKLFQLASDVETPQGVLFSCVPPHRMADALPETLSGVILLDGVQDPGNLGTILRTADALGTSVVLLEGCADRFSPKTVRATMGALFRRPVYRMDWAQARDAFHQAGLPIAVTALSPRAEDIREADVSKMAVVIGSEGRGVRPEVLEQADRELIIPMDPHCESLNAAVAATIVLWQMRK